MNNPMEQCTLSVPDTLLLVNPLASGPFAAVFQKIAKVWPSLISLDLYDNSMEGTVPVSMGRLAFVKLQLQANSFSGKVPRGLFALPSGGASVVLGLASNPNLHGCMPVGHGPPPAGTQITVCGHNDEL